MKRSPLFLLLILTAARCDANKPNPTGVGGITLAGRDLKAMMFYDGVDRSRITSTVGFLDEQSCAIAAYSRERHIHLYYDQSSDHAYDVLFLNEGGTIVETGMLDPDSDVGLHSAKPAMYAVLLKKGWAEANGVKNGGAVKLTGSAKRKGEPLPMLKIGSKTVYVELSRNDAERRRGLMHRRQMLDNDGMLFSYEGEEDPHTYWMRNTFMDLDIAFIKRDGTLLNVVETPMWEDPENGDGDRASSDGPCQYVLELRMGWFKRNGFLDADGNVKEGTKVEIPSAYQTGR